MTMRNEYKHRHKHLSIALMVGVGITLALVWLTAGSPASASHVIPISSQRAFGEVITTYTYLPIVTRDYRWVLSVDPQDRQASLDFYNEVYRASEGIASGWTGDHASCDPGTTSQAFRDAVVLRINYFRAMAGVPAGVLLSDEYNGKAQQAALMMSVNGQLSHDPPPSWTCYTAEGDEAAGSSNLYLGRFGWSAVSGYMQDSGSGNYFVGHRRWILYPQTQFMGTGDIPSVSGYWSSNALWVFDQDNMWGPRPDTREEYVAWPPPGYVPYQVVFARWSFSYDDADFSGASVSMTSGGADVPVDVQSVVNGYGENTLVWEPDATFDAPTSDETYSVQINDVLIDGVSRDFAYDVTIFDPDAQVGAPAGARPEEDAQLGIPLRLPPLLQRRFLRDLRSE